MDIQISSIYTIQGLHHAISIFNFFNDYNIKHVLYSLRYLFQYSYLQRNLAPSKDRLITFGNFLFDKYKKIDNLITGEIIDIMLEFSPKKRNYLQELKDIEKDTQREAAHIRLQIENRVQSQIEVKSQIKRVIPPITLKEDVYSDKQNVHNSNINNSVKEAIKKLVNIYDNNLSISEIQDTLINKFENKKNIIEKSIKRIKEDVATFGINISLKQVLTSLWTWILINEKYTDELLKILVDEMEHMIDMCSTGYLSRLINVTQGFSDEFIIQISNKEQTTAVITNYLNSKLQQCQNNDVLEEMTSSGNNFKKFINECIDIKREEWLKEYGQDFINYIPEIVGKYTQN